MIPQLMRRAVAYYAVMLALFSLLGCLFFNHPLFQSRDYRGFTDGFTLFYKLFLCSGLLYYLLEGILYLRVLRRPRLPLFTTPAILLLIMRRISRGASRRNCRRCEQWRRLFANKHVRTRLLTFAIKAYFGTLMVSFAGFHFRAIAQALAESRNPLAYFDHSYSLIYQAIFLVDASLAAVGYYCESALLRNRVRSVDPCAMSWVVTLACYPPFNDASGRLLPLQMNVGNQVHLPWAALVGLKVGTVFFFLIYLWATIALNIKFSNLTNRGIVRSGPYALIRHPAYLGKNLAWWLEYLPHMRHGANVIPLILWNLVYVLRALYEEKHLRADPEYVEYMSQVRYRFIPGLV